MIVKIDKSFERDANKIKDEKVLYAIADCIAQIEKVENIRFIKNIKKLKGSNAYYRIRIGDYRIGLEIKNNVAEFIRFLHRKEIYKYFPR